MAHYLDLVNRFFFDDHRQSLGADGRSYLQREFERLLGQALLRGGRFQRLPLLGGQVAWARRGSSVAPHSATATQDTCSVPEDVSRVIEQVLAAERPVEVRAAIDKRGLALADLMRSEERLSAALREVQLVRCVALDRRRGVGTHWASVEWLRARLPSDAQLQPLPVELFRPSSDFVDEDPAEEIVLSAEAEHDEVDHTPATRSYVAQVDEVLAGSLILEPGDLWIFPTQPNPAWIEIQDEDEVRHDGLLFRRGGQVELFGVQEILLEGGGSGLRLRLRPTQTPYIFSVETHGIDEAVRDGAERDSRLARQVWRELLVANRCVPLEELASELGATPERVRAVLQAYRCFTACLDALQTWEIDRTQPGLRPRLVDTSVDVHLLDSMITEGRAIVSTLHHLRADLDWLEEGVSRVLGGKR